MITQTHTLNPSIDNTSAVSDLSAYLCSVQVWEIFSNKGFIRFRDWFINRPSVWDSVFVPILNAFMQKVRSGTSKVFSSLSKVELIRGCFMKYVGVDKVLSWPFYTSLKSRVLYVFSLGSFFQMVGVTAFRVITNVHKHFSFSNGSVVEQSEGNPVSQKLSWSPISVALVLGGRVPFPTNIGVFLKRNVNVFPKIMVVVESGYRIINNIFKRVHMKSTYLTAGFSQPCYGGKL